MNVPTEQEKEQIKKLMSLTRDKVLVVEKYTNGQFSVTYDKYKLLLKKDPDIKETIKESVCEIIDKM